MNIIQFEVRLFCTQAGKVSFIDWLYNLKNKKTRQIIQTRIDRLSLGILGNYKNLGDGVGELKINHGPGYRVYFALEENKIILLLLAGDKSSQNEDIKKAKKYWKECKEKKYD